MGIGQKIKEYRLKQNLTQKDLADKLAVTYQAVSRWENDEVEPSFDTLNQLATLFHCTLDDLFGRENNNQNKFEAPTNQNNRVVLGVCENCNEPIFDGNKLKRFEEEEVYFLGGNTHLNVKKRIFCEKCYNEKIEQENKEKEEENKYIRKQNKKSLIAAIIWSIVAASLLLFLGYSCSTVPDVEGEDIQGSSLAIFFYILAGVSVIIIILGRKKIKEK